MKGVRMLGGVSYLEITPQGLRIARDGVEEVLPVASVVLCAGQLPDRGLADRLAQAGIAAHVIGGADVAAELDAKRAIDQGARLAAGL
jgi:2,4-dienoyl-CoA reductase (NADPH2)